MTILSLGDSIVGDASAYSSARGLYLFELYLLLVLSLLLLSGRSGILLSFGSTHMLGVLRKSIFFSSSCILPKALYKVQLSSALLRFFTNYTGPKSEQIDGLFFFKNVFLTKPLNEKPLRLLHESMSIN
jgi:hypothetical protein